MSIPLSARGKLMCESRDELRRMEASIDPVTRMGVFGPDSDSEDDKTADKRTREFIGKMESLARSKAKMEKSLTSLRKRMRVIEDKMLDEQGPETMVDYLTNEMDEMEERMKAINKKYFVESDDDSEETPASPKYVPTPIESLFGPDSESDDEYRTDSRTLTNYALPGRPAIPRAFPLAPGAGRSELM